MSSSARRLSDLLIDPRETLDVEIKEWLDIQSNNDHRALLAKAIVALANHGGGFILIGLTKGGAGFVEAAGRPSSLMQFTSDEVNSVVLAFAEPPFHCDVILADSPAGSQYPIISVPGGHRVPVKSRRDGPGGAGIKQNCYYIRRPGPQSEVPQNGREWDELIQRCIGNARTELLDQMRAIFSGRASSQRVETESAATEAWFVEAKNRWNEVVASRPQTDSAKMPLGHFALSYILSGNIQKKSSADLLDALSAAKVRHTGWAEFWVPTKNEIKPYLHNGLIECWIARDGEDHGPAHSDFWLASPEGKFFLIRGFQEDEMGRHGRQIRPGSVFDVTVPSWRVGEALLHASSMAGQMGDPQATITMVFEWTGLSGRSLTHLEGRRLLFDGEHVSHQDVFRTSISVRADQVGDGLPELVDRVVRPLYEIFNFFRLPDSLVAEELARMRSNHF